MSSKVSGAEARRSSASDNARSHPGSASSHGPRHRRELHGQTHDALTGELPVALEASQWLLAGRPDHVLSLVRQVQRFQLQYMAARQQFDRCAVTHATGLYFHGDVLSVRTEHVELDENGDVRASAGMTQSYACPSSCTAPTATRWRSRTCQTSTPPPARARPPRRGGVCGAASETTATALRG